MFSRSLSRFAPHVVSRPSDLVGNTPLLDLTSLFPAVLANNAKLWGKMESLGPCSSVKDRLGKSMIDAAEKSGAIKPGMTLVEPTSGNTGIALAYIARERGYKCILTMPETMSVERRVMLLALGAEVVLTPKETAVSGALAKATEILEGLGEQGHMLQQFENPSNAAVHRDTTGPEIWRDTEGTVDVFVAGVGTGGTVTGTTQYLKGCGKGNCEGCDQTSCGGVNKQIYTVAVEPQEQMLLTAAKGGEKIGEQGPHRIQGMGAGIIPKVLDLDLVDEVVAVHSDAAQITTSELWLSGIPTGVSAGAIVNASVTVMSRPDMAGKTAVCIIPSFGERYFTHPMWSETAAKAHGLVKQPLPEPYDNTDYGFETARG